MFSKQNRFLSLVVTALVLLPLLSACGGPATVDVSMTNYSIKLSANTVKAGEVIFNIRNDAADQVHEFVVIRTDTPADQLSLNSDNEADESILQVVDEIEDIDPGKSGQLKVNLTAGHYVLICNTLNHYTLGMRQDFTVSP